jgi:outer membrane protein
MSVAPRRPGRIAALLALAALLPVPAVSAAGAELGLERAIELAAAGDPSLAAAQALERSAAAGLDEARAAALPRLELSADLARTTDPVRVFGGLLAQQRFTAANFDLESLNHPDPLDHAATRLELQAPLYTGGRLKAAREAAASLHSAAAADRERSRQLLVRRVIEVYTGTVLAEAGVASLEKAVAAATENRRLAADLYESGLVVESDLLQAGLRLAELEEALAKGRAEARVSRAALELLVGPPPPDGWQLDQDLAAPALAESQDAAAASLDTRRRPDLAAAGARERAALAQIELRQAERRPTIGAGALLEAASDTPFGADGSHWSVGLSARFTLFDGGAGRARRQRAQAEAEAARAARRALEDAAWLEATEAAELRTAARQRLEAARAAAGFADRSLEIVRDRYREGLASWVELLGAEAALTAADSRELDARRSLVLAGVRLALATGSL